MDVSADLTELGRTPVAVVCAGALSHAPRTTYVLIALHVGAKSILDIPRTLEVLETQGVAVVGFGTDEFPAFFTPHSGCPTSCRLDTAPQVAKLIRTLFFERSVSVDRCTQARTLHSAPRQASLLRVPSTRTMLQRRQRWSALLRPH